MHYFQDGYTDNAGLLHIDSHQDYKLVDAWSEQSTTSVVFHRTFDTCDDDDYQIDNGTVHIIYFLASGSPSKVAGVNITELTPGLQRVQLLKPDIPPPQLPDDVWTFEILAPKVSVPSSDTTYWWYITKLPPLRKKHHIVQYEGVIEAGNEGLVHHMEVFHCEVPKGQRIPAYNGPGLSEGKPHELRTCRKVIGAWAMGAQAMVYPEEAGTPIGGRHISHYVLLEVHYNNPDMEAGHVDSSGIRFYVTSKLRRYDAGIMELGLEYTDKMAIPPRQEIFKLVGDCIEECTNVGLPKQGIKMFASQLHTHLTGRRIYTQHIRGGVELPELNRDNHYSPHFQEIRTLPEPVEVLPGDALITVCEDSTSDKDIVTLGGFSIKDEMCVNYVHYYPRVNLEVCKSSIDTKVLDSFFKFMHDWDDDNTSPYIGNRRNYEAIRWTPLNAHLLKTLYKTTPLSMQCNQSSGERFPGHWEGMPQTQVIDSLPPPQRPCIHDGF